MSGDGKNETEGAGPVCIYIFPCGFCGIFRNMPPLSAYYHIAGKTAAIKPAEAEKRHYEKF